MRVGVQAKGPSLVDAMKDEGTALERGVTAAVARAGEKAQATLRGETAAALGQGLANAWRRTAYPIGQPSANAAQHIWSKAPRVHDAFDRGALIKSLAGEMLAIPLPAAGMTRGRGGRSAGRAGKPMRPRDWARRNGVKLRFVLLNPGKALLVADNMTMIPGSTRFIRNRAWTDDRRQYSPISGATSVPVFLLVRRVKLPKLLSLDRHADGGLAVLALELDQRLRAA